MKIIVSGADKVGKTTLVAKLGLRYGCKTIKFGRTIPNVQNVAQWVEQNFWFHVGICCWLEQTNDKTPIIIDRFYPDEIVYSHVIRGVPMENMYNTYRDLDKRFAELGFVYVYVHPPYAKPEWMKRLVENDEKLSYETGEKIVESFGIFNSWTSLPRLFITQENQNVQSS